MAANCLWSGFGIALAIILANLAVPVRAAEEEVRLQEMATPGRLYHVEVNFRGDGRLTVPNEKNPAAPPQTQTSSALSTTKYDERILEAGADGLVQRTVRVYRELVFQRKAGGREELFSLRPEIRRVVWQRRDKEKVPFSPDGPFTWGELDAVQRELMTTTLLGLLPNQPVRPGATWPARPETVVELTDLDPVQEGGLECRFDAVEQEAGRRYARVSFRGQVRGLSEDGPSRHEIDGFLKFDLQTSHLSYLTLTGKRFMLDGGGREAGQHRGVFVLSRQADAPAPAELTDAALAGKALAANADNTLLLYADPELGVRMNYPRRWHEQEMSVERLEVSFAAPGGAGLKLSLLPPERVPAAAKFQADVQAYLRQANARVLGANPPRVLRAPPQGLEHFALALEPPGGAAGQAGPRLLWDFYVLRQTVAGATIAAQVPAEDKTGLRQELERMMLSLTLSRPVAERR